MIWWFTWSLFPRVKLKFKRNGTFFFEKRRFFVVFYGLHLFLKNSLTRVFQFSLKKWGRGKSPFLKRKKVPFLIRFLDKRYLFTNFLLKTLILRTFFPCKNYVVFGLSNTALKYVFFWSFSMKNRPFLKAFLLYLKKVPLNF